MPEPTTSPEVVTSPKLDSRSVKGKRGWRRVVAASRYSFDGFAAAWKHEAAFRQELALAVILTPIAIVLPFAAVERMLLIGVLLLVLIVELLNSALEAAVDRVGLHIDPLAKQAKDIGSAAVMLSLFAAAACWIALLASHFL